MSVDNIDYSKSIKSNRVVLKSKWMELIDIVLFFCAIGIFTIYNIKVFIIEGVQNNIIMWFFISPLSVLLMVFLAYKKINEKKFFEIETSYDKNKNREIVIDFVKENGFLISYDNANYLIAEKLQQFASAKQITFLFSSKSIKLNCLTITARVRTPVFFYHNALKRKLLEKISNSLLSTKV